MDDEYQELIAQLRELHARGHDAHQRFLEAHVRHDVDSMNLLNEEHQALAMEARDLVTRLRAVVDAHFAPLRGPDDT